MVINRNHTIIGNLANKIRYEAEICVKIQVPGIDSPRQLMIYLQCSQF